LRLLSAVFAHTVLYLEFTLVSVVQGEGTLLATGSYDGQARIWTTNGRHFYVLIFYNSIFFFVSKYFMIVFEDLYVIR